MCTCAAGEKINHVKQWVYYTVMHLGFWLLHRSIQNKTKFFLALKIITTEFEYTTDVIHQYP